MGASKSLVNSREIIIGYQFRQPQIAHAGRCYSRRRTLLRCDRSQHRPERLSQLQEPGLRRITKSVLQTLKQGMRQAACYALDNKHGNATGNVDTNMGHVLHNDKEILRGQLLVYLCRERHFLR